MHAKNDDGTKKNFLVYCQQEPQQRRKDQATPIQLGQYSDLVPKKRQLNYGYMERASKRGSHLQRKNEDESNWYSKTEGISLLVGTCFYLLWLLVCLCKKCFVIILTVDYCFWWKVCFLFHPLHFLGHSLLFSLFFPDFGISQNHICFRVIQLQEKSESSH